MKFGRMNVAVAVGEAADHVYAEVRVPGHQGASDGWHEHADPQSDQPLRSVTTDLNGDLNERDTYLIPFTSKRPLPMCHNKGRGAIHHH